MSDPYSSEAGDDGSGSSGNGGGTAGASPDFPGLTYDDAVAFYQGIGLAVNFFNLIDTINANPEAFQNAGNNVGCFPTELNPCGGYSVDPYTGEDVPYGPPNPFIGGGGSDPYTGSPDVSPYTGTQSGNSFTGNQSGNPYTNNPSADPFSSSNPVSSSTSLDPPPLPSWLSNPSQGAEPSVPSIQDIIASSPLYQEQPSTPALPNSGLPSVEQTNPFPDWTTQTAWVFPSLGYIPQITNLDTGNRALNFLLNDVVLPWRNLAAALEEIPIDILSRTDRALANSPFGVEYRGAFQNMAPMSKAMGLAMEIPAAVKYLSAWVATSQELSGFIRAPAYWAVGAGGLGGGLIKAPQGSSQTLLFGADEMLPTMGGGELRSALPSASSTPKALAIADEFIPVAEGSQTLVSRQLQLYEISPSLRGAGSKADWNRLMRFLYKFEPKPGATYNIQGVSYTFDSERRLVRVSTDKILLGQRWDYINRIDPKRMPGHDYGHVGGIEAFGANDYLIQEYGGYPQSPFMNRFGDWRIAEEISNNVVYDLQGRGIGWNKVAEVRNFVNGVPTEWRLYIETPEGIPYDSGWLSAGLP